MGPIEVQATGILARMTRSETIVLPANKPFVDGRKAQVLSSFRRVQIGQ